MGHSYTRQANLETTPPVRRFYSDKKKAIEAAQIIYTKMAKKEAVYIFIMMHGIFENKTAEYSVRLASEGARIDSIAIVHRYEPKIER